MITLITLLIFTAAFAGAAEYAWWSPARRTRQEIEHRLRGLRVEAGRRPDSLLRQQYSSSGTFLSKLEIISGCKIPLTRRGCRIALEMSFYSVLFCWPADIWLRMASNFFL